MRTFSPIPPLRRSSRRHYFMVGWLQRAWRATITDRRTLMWEWLTAPGNYFFPPILSHPSLSLFLSSLALNLYRGPKSDTDWQRQSRGRMRPSYHGSVTHFLGGWNSLIVIDSSRWRWAPCSIFPAGSRRPLACMSSIDLCLATEGLPRTARTSLWQQSPRLWSRRMAHLAALATPDRWGTLSRNTDILCHVSKHSSCIFSLLLYLFSLHFEEVAYGYENPWTLVFLHSNYFLFWTALDGRKITSWLHWTRSFWCSHVVKTTIELIEKQINWK